MINAYVTELGKIRGQHPNMDSYPWDHESLGPAEVISGKGYRL